MDLSKHRTKCRAWLACFNHRLPSGNNGCDELSDLEDGSHPDQKHFLVDAMTREGMSGAPVVTQSGGSTFLGIYSGRLPDEPEIGIVWRSTVVQELVERATRGSFSGT